MNDWFEDDKLHFAAEEGNLDEIKKLIEIGFAVNDYDEGMSFTPLHYAVENEHYEVAKYLLELGADINAHDEDKIGETPLGQVSPNCSYKMAKFLVDNGANPCIVGWMGLTSLDRAKERKKEEGKMVYELLLKTAKSKFNYRA